MLMWILSQVAVPHATVKPTNWWAVVIHDTSFASCSKCVYELTRDIYRTFNGTVERVTYSEMKRSLYIWTVPGSTLDTERLKEVLNKEGVRSYEILH